MLFSQFRGFLSKPFNTSHQHSKSKKRKVAAAIQMAVENLEGRAFFSFSAPVSYLAGAAPVSMISGDFNSDGHADVLTTNYPAGVVTLLGKGDGSFGAPQSTPLGSTPGSTYTGSQAGTSAVADYNGDGKLDVTVVSGLNGITLLGNGDGTFGAPMAAYLGNSPTRISTGDVNRDGHADLFVANDSGNVGVLLGNGDGTFATGVEYAAGPSPQDVKAVDLNHDGKLDLVVAGAVSAGSVSTLMGNGDGTFQAYRSYAAFSAPYRMDVADYNGDGNMDVGVANSYTSSCVTILLGNPDGTFQPYHSYNTGYQPWELESADVDGDGRPDLIDSNGSSYQVQLNNGDGTFGAPTTTLGAGFVFAANDYNGDGTADIAGASGANVGVLINNSSAIINVSTATSIEVSAPATTTAGAPLPLTLSAVDSSGNLVTDFTGWVHVTTTDSRMSGLTYTFTAADAGTHTFGGGVALFTAGIQTITASGPAQLTGSRTINVTAAAASQFAIAADATGVAGSAVSFTVTAQDAFGNFAADYTGTVQFSSSDVQAALPANYTFSASDAGVANFSAILKTAGAKTVTATDTLAASTRGVSASILVTPNIAGTLGMVGGGGHIGSSHIVTVTAYDAYGNIATGYNGMVHLTGSDSQIVLPADGAMSNGVGNFSVTPMTLGVQTLTATSGALGATENIVGTPGFATTVAITPISGAVAGTAQTLTVTAYDAFGNVAVDYNGTVIFSSSDYQASLPYYTYTNADAGVRTFTVTLRTAGTQSLTVRDLYNPAIASTQTGILITSAAPASITVAQLHGTVAGVAQTVTVTARDIFGNIATGYRGTLNFSTSDTLAAMLATYTFTAADNGTHVFSVTLKNAGGQTFVVQDTATLSMLSSQRDIQVTPAAMSGFGFRAPSNATAGTPFSVILSAVDAFGNTIVGYTGKVHFTGASGGGNLLPADYTFSAADGGVHTFLVTFTSTGTQTLGVADTANGAFKGQTSISIKASGGGGGTATGGGGGGGGGKKIV